MNSRCIEIVFFLFITIFGMGGNVCAQAEMQEHHRQVSLRMIGHQILLQSGDSTSRVLPIEKEGHHYQLQFENDFQFEPEKLVAIIDSVVNQTGMAQKYLVEVAECASQKVVYSYEVGFNEQSDVVPCANRLQPKACYVILFTILDIAPPLSAVAGDNTGANAISAAETESKSQVIYWLFAPLLLLLAWWGLSRRRARKHITDPNLIAIGAYRFDKRNMELHLANEKTVLTSKEADLLYLLYRSANEILARERILNSVWGDEGDYIGRTLDVFISKLRKKLEADSSVKIINARGVGYKLVVNGTP